ncbi:MaoC family dehydratase [Streptomyces sp. NPDC048417]|uniref:MaoC family dehydratase n=1 Tax=Streptomyces sp. NPDC048417 TaxID=3155387 RepID=UPI0034344847
MQKVVRQRGLHFEDFTTGREFEHHWGRTLLLAESIAYSTRMMHFNPLYFDVTYARRLGHPAIPINPMLVYTTVGGLSVEDLSEAGGPFLAVEDLTFHRNMYDGDTVRASSVVLGSRASQSRPGWGVVEWLTTGRDTSGEVILSYRRSNLSQMRGES